MDYKLLPIEFQGRASQKEFVFKQLKREDAFALYEKQSEENKCIYYEVIAIQKHNGRTMPGGVFIPPSEFYPSDSSFGIFGWCYNQSMLSKAEQKFKELINGKNTD